MHRLIAVLSLVLVLAWGSAQTLLFGQSGWPVTLDTGTAQDGNSAMVSEQITETLVTLELGTTELRPGLATSWTPNEHATVWTLELREGVTFQDGTPFDAEAAKFNLDRFNDPDHPYGFRDQGKAYVPWGWIFGGPKGKGVLDHVDVVDDHTIELYLTDSVGFLPVMLSSRFFSMHSPTAIKAAGPDYGTPQVGSVGTGPFVFKEWVNGSHITLVKNPDWTWGSSLISDGGPAKLDEIVFRFIPEAQTRLATLESGETQFVDLVPFADIVRLRDSDAFAVTGFQLPGMPQMNYLNTSIAPTNELAVRQAINYAVDKQAIVDTVYFGMTEPAYGPLSNVFPEYDPSLESMYPFDPEKAEQLLTDAGWVDANGDGVREKDGKPLQVVLVENKGWNDWVYLMQAYLQDVGFDASVLTTQGPSNTAAIASGEYAAPAMGDVFATASLMTRDWERAGYGTFPSSHFWEGPELDDMLHAAEVETNPEERIAKYREIQQFIMKEALMVPIFELYFYAAHDNALTDFVVDGTGYYKYFGKASYAN